MTSQWQRKTVTLCVSAALVHCGTAPALGDSAVGVYTMLGNALNPNTLKTIPARDPEALDAAPDERTPTGKLLGWPQVLPEKKTTASGWQYFGSAEIGWMGAGGDTGSWWYNQYKDLPTDGLYLNNFYFQADQLAPGKGYFVEALGGGVGYRDQYEGLNFGRYNDWKVKLFYTEIPHTFTTTYRSLWGGVGDEYLPLSGLTPGGTRVNNRNGTANNTASQDATIRNLKDAIAEIDYSELAILRETGGLSFEKYLTNAWRLYGSYTQENRTGARPFGAVFGGGGGGGNVEIPESIDYDTRDIVAGARFDDGVNNLNLQANVSLFRNNTETLVFENPLWAAVANGTPETFTTGQFALYPNNDYTNLRAEYARSLPKWYRSRVTATVSLSRFKQDDDLLPWTQYSLNGVAINNVNAANRWSTTQALTKQSADAEIDTQMYDLALVMRPTDKLDVNGKIRYYTTDNKTEFWACNPLTGQWGRLINNGSGNAFATPNTTAGANPRGTTNLLYNATGCDYGSTQALGLVPSAGNVNIRNVPYEYSKTDIELGGEYRVARGHAITARLAREEYDREYRERDETWENMLKLGYVNRAYQWGTLRASAEYGERRGDTYNSDPYRAFYSESLGPEPSTNGINVAGWIHAPNALRKYDLADRDRLALDLRLDLIAMHDLDVGVTGQYRDLDYPDSDLGRSDHQTLGSATLDVNWQPSAKLGVTGWVTYQQASMSQVGLQPNGCVTNTTYYFYSDGTVATAPVAGKVEIGRTRVTGANWAGVCEAVGIASPLWPDSRGWQVDTDDENTAFGLSARYDLGFVRLELDGTYISGTTNVDYSYNPVALGVTALNQALAGSGMPEQSYDQGILNFNVVVPVNKSVAVRALYRYEQGTIDDWQYAGVDVNPVPTPTGNQAVYLDSGPEGYHTNTIGLLVQVSF